MFNVIRDKADKRFYCESCNEEFLVLDIDIKATMIQCPQCKINSAFETCGVYYNNTDD